MINLYQTAENKGRTKLISFLQGFCPNLEEIHTTELTAPLDLYAKIGGANFAFEVKVRDLVNKRTGYTYKDVILSTNKVAAIEKEVAEKKITKGFYACFDTTNRLYLFDLLNIPKILGTQNCPRSTVGTNKDYIQRDVYRLDINHAYIYQSNNNNQWKQIQTPKIFH